MGAFWMPWDAWGALLASPRAFVIQGRVLNLFFVLFGCPGSTKKGPKEAQIEPKVQPKIQKAGQSTPKRDPMTVKIVEI